MELFDTRQREQIRLFGRLVMANPFSGERTDVEALLLGRRHRRAYRAWHSIDGKPSVNSNLSRIHDLCDSLVRLGLSRGASWFSSLDSEFFQEWDLLALYWLFSRWSLPMSRNVYLGDRAEEETARLFPEFARDFGKALNLPGRRCPSVYSPEKVFALFHQIHRAFNSIYDFIAGGTEAAALLRSSIWQSIFTFDMKRYYHKLADRMNRLTTLVTGESGTGKELVARSIAFSQFIPFSSRANAFSTTHRSCFHPVQLSAMPQSLIESELFGHVKGAFTGAVSEHQGCFETCGECGAIFLDEIGEVSQETQVKLLRVLQTRQFRRVGGEHAISFRGKVISATNSNLEDACREGRFRQDLFFRLCSDTVQTAPLRTLVDGREEELRQFVLVIVKRMMEGREAEEFAATSIKWIVENLGIDYQWPGNVRELEQCLRNLLVRGEYRPPALKRTLPSQDPAEEFFEGCRLTADDVMRKYVQGVYRREGSFSATSRATQLDPRTVKKYLAPIT